MTVMAGFIRGIDDNVGALRSHLTAIAAEVEQAFPLPRDDEDEEE